MPIHQGRVLGGLHYLVFRYWNGGMIEIMDLYKAHRDKRLFHRRAVVIFRAPPSRDNVLDRAEGILVLTLNPKLP